MIQKLLDRFYYARHWVASFLAFLSIRLFGIEVTIDDVKQRKYSHDTYTFLDLDSLKAPDIMLSVAQECYDQAKTRRLLVADKCKTLLTVSSLSVALVGLLLPMSFGWNSWFMRIAFFVAIAALMNTIFLLLVLFDVGSENIINLTQENIGLSESDIKKSLINQNLECEFSLDKGTDFQVDVYKTARFNFLSGFTIIVLLFSVSLLNQNTARHTAEIARALRSDDKLLALLQGPKGDRGEQGRSPQVSDLIARIQSDPKLLDLLRGPKGEKGEQGLPADEADIVNRVLQDPKLKPSGVLVPAPRQP